MYGPSSCLLTQIKRVSLHLLDLPLLVLDTVCRCRAAYYLSLGLLSLAVPRPSRAAHRSSSPLWPELSYHFVILCRHPNRKKPRPKDLKDQKAADYPNSHSAIPGLNPTRSRGAKGEKDPCRRNGILIVKQRCTKGHVFDSIRLTLMSIYR